MGDNAQTSVPKFTSGDVLTAANTNLLSNGIPVFSGTATRNDAFGGTGEKVLAEGQFAFLEDSNATQVYDGSNWVSVGASGLVRVGGGALSSSATTFSDVFSATYDAYQIVLTNLVGSTSVSLTLTFGATTTGYYGGYVGIANDGTVAGYGANNAAGITRGIRAATTGGGAVVNVQNPFLTQRTFWQVSGRDVNTSAGSDNALGAGFVDNATSYTAFTLTIGGGTCTGTCNIYGYTLS